MQFVLIRIIIAENFLYAGTFIPSSGLCNKITEKDSVVLSILLATSQNALDLKPSAESLVV